jgi:hypothetical protein
MRIPVLASAFYNESLFIIFGIVLGIVAGGTAVAATLDLGSMEPQLRETMIQAQATIRAGLIQGTMTLAAGCAAIVAAAAAAAVAYQGVLRQVHLSESQHNARVTAYRIKLMLATEGLREQTALEHVYAKRSLDLYRKESGRWPLDIKLFTESAEFSEADWEHHALLGEEVVREIHRCRTELRDLIRFQREVTTGKGLRANDISESPTAVAHGEPGIDFQVIEENVVEENVTRTYNLFKTVDILLSLLKPGHEVDKYDLRKIGNIP